jgi:uncharacterized protein YjbJ (UPF0337 family)
MLSRLTAAEESAMKDRIESEGVDSDRVDGSLKKMGGDLKAGAGKILGDEKLKREGQSDQAEGKLQNAWGGAKDAVRDTLAGKK